jgi:hypothetical protein
MKVHELIEKLRDVDPEFPIQFYCEVCPDVSCSDGIHYKVEISQEKMPWGSSIDGIAIRIDS